MIESIAKTIAAAFVVVPYLAGFAVALPVRSWRSHVPASLVVVAVVAGLGWLLSRANFYAGAVLFFPIAGFAVGLVVGLVTRAVVLAFRWPIRSFRAVVATLIGLALPLLAWEGRQILREREVRTALALLPDAETLPRIAACERFRSFGPLFDVVLEAARGDPPDRLPRSAQTLRLPAAHRRPASARAEDNGERVRYLAFAMYVADASPVPPEERRYEFGGRNRVEPTRPFVEFDVFDRIPIDRLFERTFAAVRGGVPDAGRTPRTVRTPSSSAGLDEITADPPRFGPDREDLFVTHTDGPAIDLLICAKTGSVPKPTCRFALDQGGLAVGGDFRRTELARWPEIADHVRSFVDCARAAGEAAAAKPAGGG